MDTRCSYCGCLLRYELQEVRKPLGQATPAGVINTPGNRKLWRYQAISAAPYEDVWCVGYVCPGCGGGHHGKQEYALEEAERLVAEQNLGLETPEAQLEIAHWREEVERRAQSDAQVFGQLFLARFGECDAFPGKTNGLLYNNPCSEYGVALLAVLPWNRLGLKQPQHEIPVQAQVLNGEVIVFWQEAHEHFYRAEGSDYQQKALELMEELYREKTKGGVVSHAPLV